MLFIVLVLGVVLSARPVVGAECHRHDFMVVHGYKLAKSENILSNIHNVFRVLPCLCNIQFDLFIL